MINQQDYKLKSVFRLSISMLILAVFVQCKTKETSMRNNNYAHLEHRNSKIIKYQKPTFLKIGDTIMIVAPAGFMPDSSDLDPGIALAKSWGLEVVLGKHVYSKHNHFAGTDQERLSDMQLALDNKNIKAIWCSRGGYGTVRIIDQLDFSAFKKIQNG